jgi:hypothetical protein
MNAFHWLSRAFECSTNAMISLIDVFHSLTNAMISLINFFHSFINALISIAIAMNRFTRELAPQSETDIALRLSPAACVSLPHSLKDR